jgi:hypothetical protein
MAKNNLTTLGRQVMDLARCDVDSTCVKALSYDAGEQSIYVTFPSGQSYVYSGVSNTTYQAMCGANSKGQFFNTRIRGKYAYKRL